MDGPRRWQVALTVLMFGVAAFLLGRVLWPDPVGTATPPPMVLPIFIAISALEALLFGVGIAFIVFGSRWLIFDGSRLGTGAFVAIAWSLVSWWPHDNLHRVTHDWTGLAAIEVGFHVTLIISILIVGAYFLRSLQARSGQS
ncbi:MAG: hypothetical protein ACREOY_01100 [Candidatus Dormibacteraceae bacterium]